MKPTLRDTARSVIADRDNFNTRETWLYDMGLKVYARWRFTRTIMWWSLLGNVVQLVASYLW